MSVQDEVFKNSADSHSTLLVCVTSAVSENIRLVSPHLC